MQLYTFDMARGGKCIDSRPAMPQESGAEPGDFFTVSPAVLGRRRPRFMYGFVNLEKSGYAMDALQKWDLHSGAPSVEQTTQFNAQVFDSGGLGRGVKHS